MFKRFSRPEFFANTAVLLSVSFLVACRTILEVFRPLVLLLISGITSLTILALNAAFTYELSHVDHRRDVITRKSFDSVPVA